MEKGNKKTKIIFVSIMFGLSILAIISLYYYDFQQEDKLLNKLQNTVFDKNEILVETKNIDLNKITIELVDHSQGIVFKNGRKIKRIRNEYGGDHFRVFYDDLLIAESWIFKKNCYHTHKYFFEIIKQDSILDFNFRAEGPDCESMGYKKHYIDTLNNKLTTVFYNSKGKDGQINVDYYDKNQSVIVDECWVNDTLISLNLYKEGNWHKNYGTNKYSKTTTYKLIKEHSDDSLKYIYQTIENGKIENEIIGIEKQPLTSGLL